MKRYIAFVFKIDWIMKKGWYFLVLTLMVVFVGCKPTDDSLVVKIHSGKVKGFEQEGTQAFLGIPYAKVKRFMPALPVEAWDSEQ